MNWDYGFFEELRELQELYRKPQQEESKLPTVVPTELKFREDQPNCFFEHEGGIPFRGQDEAKRLLTIHLSTLKPAERFKCLLSGPAGTGKTTLAWIIARRIQNQRKVYAAKQGRFFEILPSQIETKTQLDIFMQQLQPYDIVFMDEIHILRHNVGAEPLYHTLDDTGTPRYPLGEGIGWLEVPSNISWIGATTEPGELDGTTGGALRRRLNPEIRLEPPGEDVLAQIVLDQPFEITEAAAYAAARRSGGLPWQVLNIYHTAVKVATLHSKYPIDEETVNEAFSALGVDQYGLFAEDRDIIKVLLQSPYKLRSTGEIRYRMSESALCSAAGVDPQTYRQIVQPRLMRLGLLTTVGGQSLTTKAVELFQK